VLELTKSFPFKRRHRLRSRQAWNECVDPMKALAVDGVADDATLALAFAVHHVAILAELVDPATARALVMQFSSGAHVGKDSAWIDRALARPI